MDEEESFFNLVTQFQSKRMDDQRCSLAIVDNKENQQASTLPSNIHGELFFQGNWGGGYALLASPEFCLFACFYEKGCFYFPFFFFAYCFDRESLEIEGRFNGPDRRHAESPDG